MTGKNFVFGISTVSRFPLFSCWPKYNNEKKSLIDKVSINSITLDTNVFEDITKLDIE